MFIRFFRAITSKIKSTSFSPCIDPNNNLHLLPPPFACSFSTKTHLHTQPQQTHSLPTSRPLSLKGIAVTITQLLRGPNIHSLSAGDRGQEVKVLAEEVAGRTAGVADLGDAEGIIWTREERREVSHSVIAKGKKKVLWTGEGGRGEEDGGNHEK